MYVMTRIDGEEFVVEADDLFIRDGWMIFTVDGQTVQVEPAWNVASGYLAGDDFVPANAPKAEEAGEAEDKDAIVYDCLNVLDGVFENDSARLALKVLRDAFEAE